MHTSDQRAMDAVNTSNQLAVSASTYCYDFETLEIGPGRLPITLVALKFIEKLAFSDKPVYESLKLKSLARMVNL